MEASRSPALIIVTGHAATGKTTFAHKLSEAIRTPLFAKDDFKELLYESCGADDREASVRLGRASYTMLRHSAETMLAAGRSLILESNFDATGSGPWINELEGRYRPRTVQVFLRANPETIMRRFRERSAHRHPAHFDDVAAGELQQRIQEPYDLLQVRGDTLKFDTTDFHLFDTELVIKKVKALLCSGN